jgi:hypothetical protein
MYVFHLFLLKEKGGAKKFKASPNRSARLAAHAQQQSFLHSSFPYFVLSSIILFSLQLVQKAMPFLQA